MHIILMFLHVATVLAKGNISCSIPAVQPMEATSLTCLFPEDLSQSRKDFSVHIANSTSKPVLDCLWVQGQLDCFTRPGFEFNMTVTDKLTMWIPRVFPNMTGQYYCKLADSTSYHIQHCQLVYRKDREEETDFLAILLPVVLPVSAVIAFLIVFFLLRKRNLTKRQIRIPEGEPTVLQEEVMEEELPMISTTIENQNQEENVDVTQMFEEYMKIEFGEMYPEEAGPLYFVPPVYFNKVRYKKKAVAGQDIYVPYSTDPSEVRHDQAMRYILECLGRIMEEKQENMFVLTQFQYDDYLNNPGDDYEQHQLPMPSDLTGEDKSVECFDFLIIHRDHGILVGVVKAVSDKDVDSESQSRFQLMDEIIIREVTEAVKQLKKADRMLRHLMSDHQQFPTIRLTLILPNLTRTSLSRAVTRDKELLKEMQEILATKDLEDPFGRCLCAVEVSNTELQAGPFTSRFMFFMMYPLLLNVTTPEELFHSFLTNMRQWWQSTMRVTDGDMKMTTVLYHSMLSRFCGPATQSAAKGQEEPFLLPKTLAESVSLTGDLYERVMLYPDMTYLQRDKRMFLTGPPNTCKTLMLTLTGEQWLSDGHNVYVICNPLVPRDSVMSAFLDRFRQLINAGNPRIEKYASVRVYEISCNFGNQKERKETVDILINKGEETLCVLAYEVDIRGKYFKQIWESLKSRCSDLHLWATSVSEKAVPDGWKQYAFKEVLKCPPAVVREASLKKPKFASPGGESQAMHYLTPTDGPPVKHIYSKLEHSRNFSDCTNCGRKVANFLLQHLINKNERRVFKEGGIMAASINVMSSTEWKKTSVLQDKDVLVLFEGGRRQEVQFLRGLTEMGIKAHTFSDTDDNEKTNAALAMNIDQLGSYRPRRKIVVYVESPTGCKDVRSRCMGITSCTSQLIVVGHNR